MSFSVSGGRYQDTFTLSIQSEGEESSTCQIRYTLNGGTPSVESFLYEGPLTVDKNLYSKSDIYKNPNAIAQYQTPIPSDVERIVVIRSAAFNAQGEICSNIATASYVVGSLLGRDITLPVLSLCVDSADLYDYQRGVFVPGASFDPARPEETGNYYLSGREHEIEGHVELIDGDVLLSQSCGVRTHGHIARRYVQKGLTLFARNEYGQKKFDPVFVHDGLRTKRLVLKPFVCAWTSMGFQDHFCQQMAKSFTSFASLKSRPVVLFLNGEYWGIYMRC